MKAKFVINSFQSTVMFTALCLVAVLTTVILSGCVKQKLIITRDLDQLSLVEIWEMVADFMDVQEDSAELESFRLHATEDRIIDTLSFVFHGVNKKGKSAVYFVSRYSNGEINWHSYESRSISATLRPMEVFTEIDKMGLSSLQLGDNGLLLQTDFQSGDVGYSNEYSDIFSLESGTLKQLDEIVFHSRYPWCTIGIYRLAPPETEMNEDGHTVVKATTAAVPVPPGTRTSQMWFLSKDLNKAETVKYLEN